MTYEGAQARKAHFAHLTNAELVAAFLREPRCPPHIITDGFVLCEMIADREEAGEDPAADYERSLPRRPCPTCGNLYDHRYPCVS